MNLKKSILTFFISIILSGIILIFNCNEPSSSGKSGGGSDKKDKPDLPVKTIAWEDDGSGFIQFYTNDSNNCGMGFFTNIGQVYDPMQSIEFEVKKISGSPYVGYGIIFCAQDSDNFYRLLIVNAGYYIISKKVDGTYSSFMADWVYTGNLNQGNGAINNIKITRDIAGNFTVYFNNNWTYAFTDATFAGGDCGFYAGIGPSNYESFPNTPADVRFRYISGSTFSSKEITSFKFTTALNPGFISDSIGTINGTNINIFIPHTADINNLIATFETTGKNVRIDTITQESGVTSNNFTNLVTYTVVAYDNSTQNYNVKVTIIKIWGSEGSGNGQFQYPNGIAIDNSGKVYVIENNNCRIQKFDSDGNYISQWGSSGSGNGQFKEPECITVDSLNNIYVSDKLNFRIQKFDSNGNYITQWGNSGSGLNTPYGITVDNFDNIFIVDTGNSRIKKFDSNGNFITQWGSYGFNNGQFQYPIGIAVDNLNNVYVVDSSNQRIQKFDSNGTFLIKWGSSGTEPGKFVEPTDIAIDDLNNVYIVDGWGNRIQKFDSDGNYITQWGREGIGVGQFNNPHGIAIDSSGNIYISDYLNYRIQVFPSTFISSLNFSKSNISFSKQSINSSKNQAGSLWQGKDNNISNLELSNQGKSK